MNYDGGIKVLFYDKHKVYMDGAYPAIYIQGKNHHIHRLEWMKHHGEIPENCVIHHKDENKLNWAIENLELISRSEHIKRHKCIVKRPGVRVIARKGAVQVDFESIEKAAFFCGTYSQSIQRILKGKQKTANGWTFERG